jgi:hypothetical protein
LPVDGRAIPIARIKERALLAVLLLSANEVVSTDRLVDRLWGSTPPPTAGKALQVCVSRLRKALGAQVIVTRAPGYLLSVEPGELDLDRFEQLVAEAHDAIRSMLRSSFATRFRCGEVRRSRTSPTRRSPRWRSHDWRSFGSQRSSRGSTSSSRSGVTSSSSASSKASSANTRCANG